MEKKPNILFIMTDQLSAGAIGHLGNNTVRTPNIDQLASEGVSFANTYCNSPICGPSRWSLMTGQYVHNHKGWDNGACLSSEEPTFAHALTLAGYETVICSRMHFHGPDQHHGYEKRLATEHNNPIFYGSEGFGSENCEIPEYDGLKQPEYSHEYPINNSPRVNHDDYVLEQAIDYLRSKSWMPRPFMLTASFLAPHPAVKRRKEYDTLFHEYVDMDLGAIELTEAGFQQLHPHIQRMISQGKQKARQYSKAENHLLLAEYYSRITYFDQQVGVLLDTLQVTGLRDSTVIVFTSDHGECMGQFGYWGKTSFYENVAKVPLIISMPDGRKTEAPGNSLNYHNVSLIDIFPTLIDFAGAQPPSYKLDGQSLLSFVKNEVDSRSNVVFSEYYGIYAKNAMFMIRKDNFKFNYYINEPAELFDLDCDQNETTNLIDNPDYQTIKKELELMLRHICLPELMQSEYLSSHYKRSFITEATAASVQTKQRMKDYIREYRRKWNEPTWDDNREQSRYEWHLK